MNFFTEMLRNDPDLAEDELEEELAIIRFVNTTDIYSLAIMVAKLSSRTL